MPITTDDANAATTADSSSGIDRTKPQKILYCLDFDGVLCDSVHETFLSGWKACKLLWKENDNSNTIGTHSGAEWIDVIDTDPKKLRQLEEDFRYVRPILYVGWEAILLLRLLAVGYNDVDNVGKNVLSGVTPPSGNRLASVREAVFRGFQNHKTDAGASSKGFRDLALESWGLAAADYGAAMSSARNTWITESEASWIDAHGFYEGACEAVRGYLRSRGNGDVYVITTKAKEFALRLLAKQGLFYSNTDNRIEEAAHIIRESHVFGLGSGPKASVLQQILEERRAKEQASNCVAVMVEDNVATLAKISRSPVGNMVLPVLVSWGYNSIEQLVNVLLPTKNTDNLLPYVVLPLLKEPSRISESDATTKAETIAQSGKERDPTGCSMASILLTPFDAGALLLASKNEKGSNPMAKFGENDDDDDPYDFVSNHNIVFECFEQNSC